MDYALQIENLSKDYGSFQLKNVSFNVPAGSIMGFVGENGAGKTTTIKLILNVIKRNSGKVKILGLDSTADEMKAKEQIGVVFDESYFCDTLKPVDISKIMKNIFHNWDEKQYFDYICRFGIDKNKIIKDLSKGMKMRMSIATALSHDPKLLILDEATSGLDPIARDEILETLREFIQKDDRAVLISSHITSDLEKIADYITFIHNGEVVLSESKDDLVYNYSVMKCGINEFAKVEKSDIIGYRKNNFGYEILVKNKSKMTSKYSEFVFDNTNIEDIMLYYVRGKIN